LSGCNKVTDVAVLSICAHAVRLENLELSGCDRISDISILELGSAVIRSKQGVLGAGGAAGLPPTSPSSAEPGANASADSAVDTEQMLQGTSQTLRSLDLSHCTRITDTGIRGLRQGAVQLTSLNLEGCYGVLASNDDLEANEWEDVEENDDLDVDSDLDVTSY